MVYTFCVVDVKEYISSGILESVVLGLATEQEKQEVRCMAHIYPEIAEELAAVEQAFEKLAFETAVAPADHLRASILSAIQHETQDPLPEAPMPQEAKIISMSDAKPADPNPWKWIAAASVVMLIGVSALWINATGTSEELQERIARMKNEEVRNEQVMTAMKLDHDRMVSIQNVLTDNSMKKVMMTGTPKDPQSAVSVMWSSDGKKAIMKASSITAPPKDMQYQLWAIADGKPMSLGLFDYDELMNMTEPFDVAMNNIAAFAITLEKRGGSASPTLENMVVMGQNS